jgi:23S rRNA (cytosine1962-C5)-methyltransferase
MDRFPSVILKPGKEAAVLRRHPWIFSGAIDHRDGDVREGDIVEVFSSDRKYLATGHFLQGSIAVKLFSFPRTIAGFDFWLGRLRQALELRRKAGLTDSIFTSTYRLVFSEGDELPGLIIDWYNGVAVVQTHSLGMHNIKSLLVDALKEIYGEKLLALYDKSSETMARALQSNERRETRTKINSSHHHDQFLFGSCGAVEITEPDVRPVLCQKPQSPKYFLLFRRLLCLLFERRCTACAFGRQLQAGNRVDQRKPYSERTGWIPSYRRSC